MNKIICYLIKHTYINTNVIYAMLNQVTHNGKTFDELNFYIDEVRKNGGVNV